MVKEDGEGTKNVRLDEAWGSLRSLYGVGGQGSVGVTVGITYLERLVLRPTICLQPKIIP